MSSPFIWFHNNGKKPNETKVFLEFLLNFQSSEGPGGMTMLATSAGPFAALGSKEDRYGEIASLYALLEGFQPTPGVRVNRAFALGKSKGPAEGLELLERADIDAAAYTYVHLVRGALLADAGDGEAAVRSLREAARCARNEHERAQIEKRISQLPAPWGGR